MSGHVRGPQGRLPALLAFLGLLVLCPERGGPLANPVELVVIAFPWGAYLGADALNKGIRAHLSTFHLGSTGS